MVDFFSFYIYVNFIVFIFKKVADQFGIFIDRLEGKHFFGNIHELI